MRALLLVGLVACATTPETPDVVGPFTGATHRFVVDRFGFPTNTTEARAVGDDLNGDHAIDNQLGMLIGTLGSQGDVTTSAADMIAAGSLASSVEIVADDLANDPTVSVRYLGADGDPAVVAGGTFIDGSFRSNRTATTRVPGRAKLRLPVFVDADPTVAELAGMEIDLVPDGAGGYDGVVRGGVEAALDASFAGIQQMLASDPDGHLPLLTLLDANHDHVVTRDEVESNSFMTSLFQPDLVLDGQATISLGFTIHLSPCESGRCARPVVDHCHDRIVDAGETDVDCGGTCGACVGAAHCASDADCESQGCDALTDTCKAPTCNDGVRDGFETDVDCGTECGPCAANEQCWTNADCASGICGAQCTSEAPYACIRAELDRCM